MVENEIRKSIAVQKAFYSTGKTGEVAYRIDALKRLRSAIFEYEEKLSKAVYSDLKKSSFEFYLTEISMVREELDLHIKNIKKWAKPKRVKNSLLQFKSKSFISKEPYGQVLIVSPWNYPFQLIFLPLIGAISAGNTVVVKPSPDTPETSVVMEELIRATFPPEHVTVFQGAKETNTILFNEKFDLIFFTGSPRLGRVVMQAASKNLTPVILELGGKSPCIVHKDADLKLAARRIIWGKNLNAGQTCTAPDYLMVHKDVKDELLNNMKKVIRKFWGDDPKTNQDFSRIVNDIHMNRLAGLMKSGDIITEGEVDLTERYIPPTIIDNIQPQDPVMQEEIFGPILPVLDFEEIDEAVDFINSRPKPLALYIFSKDSSVYQSVISKTSSGGCTVNDTLMHVSNNRLPFGGIGESGMGQYHGKLSFEAFSHKRSILVRSNLMDASLRYAPYREKDIRLIKMISG